MSQTKESTNSNKRKELNPPITDSLQSKVRILEHPDVTYLPPEIISLILEYVDLSKIETYSRVKNVSSEFHRMIQTRTTKLDLTNFNYQKYHKIGLFDVKCLKVLTIRISSIRIILENMKTPKNKYEGVSNPFVSFKILKYSNLKVLNVIRDSYFENNYDYLADFINLNHIDVSYVRVKWWKEILNVASPGYVLYGRIQKNSTYPPLQINLIREVHISLPRSALELLKESFSKELSSKDCSSWEACLMARERFKLMSLLEYGELKKTESGRKHLLDLENKDKLRYQRMLFY
jgi:hypothetical protein